MEVLTVIAHPNPSSFCHAVLHQFRTGLKDAGHTCEEVDLYAIQFDPVFHMRDFASYIHESMPAEVLESMNLKQRVLESAGNPVLSLIASWWLRDKDPVTLAKFIHEHRPKDVVEQWEKVKHAQGLAFISPVYWLHFPAILKGWFERVFAYGDAYALTDEGWRGEVKGRVPLLTQEKALVINTTHFREEDYKNGLERAMATMIDGWGLRYPGIKRVEHVYFYGVGIVDPDTHRSYLERAYCLGKEFALS